MSYFYNKKIKISFRKKCQNSNLLLKLLKIQEKIKVCIKLLMMKNLPFMDYTNKVPLEITLKNNHGLFNSKLKQNGLHGPLKKENQKIMLKMNILN